MGCFQHDLVAGGATAVPESLAHVDELDARHTPPRERRYYRRLADLPAFDYDAVTANTYAKEDTPMAIRTADVIMPGNNNAFETGKRGQISSIADLDPSYRWMLEKNVTATLATIKPNGLPQLTPVWLAHDGRHILLNTKKGRVKDRNMRARPEGRRQ